MPLEWYNGWSPEQRLATLPAQREAIRTGAIARPITCSICGENSRPDNPVWLHDENYAEPLAAYHVCRGCHRAVHERFDSPGHWRTLVDRFGGNGDKWFERLTMEQAAMRQPFGITYPHGLPRPGEAPGNVPPAQ